MNHQKPRETNERSFGASKGKRRKSKPSQKREPEIIYIRRKRNELGDG